MLIDVFVLSTTQHLRRCLGLSWDEGKELTFLVHLVDNIEASNQFAVNIELRVGRPVAILLETLPHFGVAKNIKVSKLDPSVSKQRHGPKSKSVSHEDV